MDNTHQQSTINYSKLLAKAIAITAQAFDDKFDRGGKPYILHCLWVMNKVRHLGTKYMIVAILHDLIEDTQWTYQQLYEQGFTQNILQSLRLLDFRNVDYLQQIKKLTDDDVATQVKLRDLEHNSKITRLKGLNKKDFNRLEKYSKAYAILKQYRK